MSSLIFCCFQQVSDMHSHLSSYLCLDLSEIKSFISCNNSILLLPRVALPNIIPSTMSWSKLSCPRTCPCSAPNYFQFAPSFIGTYQHLFVTFSVQLIFSILRHIHISNASNGFYRASYASTVLAVIVCPSVCLSVCHKSELYKDRST